MPKKSFLPVLDVLTAVLFIGAAGMVFFYAPVEAVMGPVQKIFYFHVAAAWVGMLSYLIAAVCAGLYLRTADLRWDRASLAGVEIGLVFTMITLLAGMIWAKPIWGTYWTWDPRLTTAAIMELVYFAYLILRQGVEEPTRRARFGAVYAIVGFISVPLTFLSIRFTRTIHPTLIGSGDPSAVGTFNMDPAMTLTFMISLAVFTVLFVDLYWHRLRLARLAAELEERKLGLQE
jgi:heme exporter protein C